MGLIKETAAEYYSGQADQWGDATVSNVINWPQSMVPLIWSVGETPTSVNNFNVFIDNVAANIASNAGNVLYNGTWTVTSTMDTGTGILQQVITLTTDVAVPATSNISIRLNDQTLWQSYGSYSYVSLSDVVNNFMIAYVGTDKLVEKIKRSDVIFHAKRSLQEFSYDTLKSVNSQELTIPPSLSLIMPQDYVNYVQMSWVDGSGVKHVIYPTTLTSNPTFNPVQDNTGQPTQDVYGNNIEGSSLTDGRWSSNNNANISGDRQNNFANVYNWDWSKMAYGQRYGLDPVTSNKNGWFTINEREGKFSFSSSLANKLIVLEYISDGLAYGMDTKIPKMAEDALYASIIYNIIAYRPKTPEYIVQRYKKESSAKLRNAKIRLSNIKLDTFIQVMRGKSKWIKH